MKIIGLIGENGSGKGTVVEILKEMFGKERVVSIRQSAFLKETLAYFDIPQTRKNFQLLADFLRSIDPSILGRKTEREIQTILSKTRSSNDLKYIIIDGIRKPEEAQTVSKFSGTLLYVTADPELRFQRLKLRTEKKGEAFMDFTQFQKEERALAEKDIVTIGKSADVVIENNGNVEELQKLLQKLVAEQKL